MAPARRLTLDPATLALCRLDPAAPPPAPPASGIWALLRRGEELALVAAEDSLPATAACIRGWRALVVEGPLDSSLVGVLAGILAPLAAAGVSVMTYATFDTDVILVRQVDLERAVAALRAAGYGIVE
ncbi:MAG: ACT domain-containing protein [Nannocystaceae bacterium]